MEYPFQMSSFMWTTIHVLLWNYVIHTSGGIVPYGHEDKSIDLRRRPWYASQSDKRQVRDTRPVTNGKFNEPSPIAGLDHMGNPFLRLPPSGSSVTVKKPLGPSGNRDKSRPKNKDSVKSNHLGKVLEKNMLRIPQESSQFSSPTIFPDTSYNAASINYALNNFENDYVPSDGSTGIANDNFFSSSSNENGISPFMQRDNVSPQSVFKSNNPSIFSNEQLPNAIINSEPCDDNGAQPIKSLEQRLWNEEMQPSFFDFTSPTIFPEDKPLRPIHTGKDFLQSKIIDDDENKSSKFLQFQPQTINPKSIYHKESMFENKPPLFSSTNRFTAPLDALYGERIQSDWLSQMIDTPGIKSQSIPPEISLLYGQKHPTIDLAESPKLTKTAAITSTSKPISMEKTESTARLDEQEQQITTLSGPSQLTESSFMTSTIGPPPMEKVESTTLPDEQQQQQQQMTDLPESLELTETPVSTTTIKPTGIEEDESTSPSYEQPQTTVTDVPESPKFTEAPSVGSTTSEPAPTGHEESTSPPREKPSRPLPVPAKPVKTPAVTKKPEPTSLEKKPPMFIPYEQSLFDWSSPPRFINTLESLPPSFPAQGDTSIASPWAFPYKNEQQLFSTNSPQFITPSEHFKNYNDAYQQFLQHAYTFQPTRNFFSLSQQNQSPFAVPKFSNPQNTLSEYYSHMLSGNVEHCLNE